MTFDELVAEVYEITSRPDLVAETKSAVRAATLKAHQTDYYSKDIWEDGVEFTEAGYRQSLDYMNLYSNFRAFKYVRRVEDKNDDVGKFFDIITVDETLDSYGVNRTDIAYIAGRVLEMRASVSFSKILLGCYVFPIVTKDTYESWITDMHPYAIINEAARVLFKAIGFDEQSSMYNQLVAEEYQLLKITGLTDVGS